jgi:fatty acid desaturase
MSLIQDKRDIPFVRFLLLIHLTVLPVTILLFTPVLNGVYWWLVAIPYFLYTQFYLKGRFGLMFHCMCHRKTFKPKLQPYLHNYITWIICPLFGHAPEGYYSHHVGMHHLENNMEEDTSSTLKYQRDSLWGFLAYFMDFMINGVVDTLKYLKRKNRRKMYLRFMAGEFIYLLFCIIIAFVNLKFALFILIIPVIFSRLVSMLGNWTQHSFVDHEDPDNAFKNSINCINTKYNTTCWNDGYHIIHHLRPGMHYTDMPEEFLNRTDELAANRSLVFDGVHYLHIFFWLMTRQYDKLADNVVNLHNTFRSREEVISLMKERTMKFSS